VWASITRASAARIPWRRQLTFRDIRRIRRSHASALTAEPARQGLHQKAQAIEAVSTLYVGLKRTCFSCALRRTCRNQPIPRKDGVL
jgi:hypothetical protein